MHDLARRADRSLRTQIARRIAAEAVAFIDQFDAPTIGAETLIASLRKRPMWSHMGGVELGCGFGTRRRVVRVAAVTHVRDVAAMIARTEVRLVLGDAPEPLVAHLQEFADSELRRWFAAREASGDRAGGHRAGFVRPTRPA